MWKWIIALALFSAGALSGYFFALYGSEIMPGTFMPSPLDLSPHPVRTVDLSVRDGEVYRVRKVVDGDTVVFDNGLHLRYSGINAPETGHFVKDAAPLGPEATLRNIQLVEGRRVRLTLPKNPLDNYGRLVGHIEVIPEDRKPEETAEEADPQRLLLREGLAKILAMGLEHDEQVEFKAIEADAKARKVGIWGLEDKARLEGAGKPYVAAEKGTVYHLRLCKTAHSIMTANLHEYATAEQAEQAGFKPCPRCVLKEP